MSNASLQPVPSGRAASANPCEPEKIFRKVAWRIMPVLFLIFVLSYMDRVNIGYAKLQFSRELGLSDAMYGTGAGIFFIGYLVSGIPSNLLLARIGARATISRIMISWGIVSSLMTFISTPAQFYLLRFLLGLAEGGLAPGVYLYLTYWFPSTLRARMIAIFLAAIPVAGVLCAPMSGFLLDIMHNVYGLAGWQWMFLIEGLPSVVVGVLIYFLIENSPNSAPWLTASERETVSTALASDVRNNSFTASRVSVSDAFKSRIFFVLVVIEIIGGVSVAGFAYWLPQIVHDLGVTSLRKNGVITAIPYLSASVGMVIWGYSSDYFHERRWHYAIAASGGGFALFVACQNASHFQIAIGALALAYTGIMSCVSVFWAYATAYLKGGAAVVGIGILNSIASLAAYLSQYAFGAVSMAKNNSLFGLYGIAFALFVGAILMLSAPQNLQTT
ncbi:MFS transporter [Paraburkholderia caribensis]|uniref:MFS transporter n=1 Tax=Paraburkholderia caribensis TaxID=75105 RepID=UPI001CAB4D6B|nr:MFS transporter [Paraburkholderia caribensis]CAG9261690.1 Major facilitator superfamily MFS_1 [Paraburkholderia caribensis]